MFSSVKNFNLTYEVWSKSRDNFFQLFQSSAFWLYTFGATPRLVSFQARLALVLYHIYCWKILGALSVHFSLRNRALRRRPCVTSERYCVFAKKCYCDAKSGSYLSKVRVVFSALPQVNCAKLVNITLLVRPSNKNWPILTCVFISCLQKLPWRQ